MEGFEATKCGSKGGLGGHGPQTVICCIANIFVRDIPYELDKKMNKKYIEHSTQHSKMFRKVWI